MTFAPNTLPCLWSLHPSELADALDGPGRARAVYRVLADGDDPFHTALLPDGLRERLKRATRPGDTSQTHAAVATDQTTKLLLTLADGGLIETVLIPDGARATLCVSSQVGCARGCRFCVTATMGLVRNLRVDEILQQVWFGLRAARARGWRLRNLVFMGMGEPLDNIATVRHALDALTDGRGYGFAPKHITVSTVGPRLSSIAQLRGWPARIAWSLHAADEDVRARLVPPPHPPVVALADAFAEVCATDRRPLFVEMTLMDGVNDRDVDMAAAAALFRTFPTEVRFNLIAMNPGRADLRPSPRVQACRQALQAAGYFCSVRRPRGQDAAAACGQLVARIASPIRRDEAPIGSVPRIDKSG